MHSPVTGACRIYNPTHGACPCAAGCEQPKVKLTDEDGNAYAIIGRCCSALRRAGYESDQIDEFTREATSGDYDKVIQTAMRWLDVE